MKKYESPVILENEDLAEGIYANSGANPSGPEEPQCWTVSVSKEQVVSHEKYANFRVRANHISSVHKICLSVTRFYHAFASSPSFRPLISAALSLPHRLFRLSSSTVPSR